MSTSVALARPLVSIRTFAVLIALVAMFILGGAAGYVVKSNSISTAPAAAERGAACPSQSHAVVYYTAHTWECVPG